MNDATSPRRTAALEPFIESQGYPNPQIDEIIPLRGEESDGLKAMGYGAPVRVRFRSGENAYDWVFRTEHIDAFGHEREADRWANAVLARHTFNRMPRHVRVRSFGVLDADGERHPIPDGQPFLVTDYVPGEPYARDLERLGPESTCSDRDLKRARTLATYLADLHAEPGSAMAYRRTARDLLGDGEGIFGLTESYPADDPVASRPRLVKLEKQAIDWRWRLFDDPSRCRRTHGDFHPFNLLFDDDDELKVLDCSRGGAGEPMDDLTALTVNFVFFGLRSRGALSGAMLALWDEVWKTYLSRTQDTDGLALVGPFFAWRALVLASPAWYPSETPDTRDRLLRVAERLLAGDRFHPSRVQELLD